MTCHPTPRQVHQSIQSMRRVVELIESGEIVGFSEETLSYMRDLSYCESGDSNDILTSAAIKQWLSDGRHVSGSWGLV